MRRVAISFLPGFFCVALALAQPAFQERGRFSVAGLDNDSEVEQFFISFKEAIAKGDKRKVASLVSYPIMVNLANGRRTKIGNVADFVRAYDHIFDAKFKRLIATTEVKDLWAKYSGVAMPGGEIWFNGIVRNVKRPERYVIKITTINRPIRS
jgi:hypothetical protein